MSVDSAHASLGAEQQSSTVQKGRWKDKEWKCCHPPRLTIHHWQCSQQTPFIKHEQRQGDIHHRFVGQPLSRLKFGISTFAVFIVLHWRRLEARNEVKSGIDSYRFLQRLTLCNYRSPLLVIGKNVRWRSICTGFAFQTRRLRLLSIHSHHLGLPHLSSTHPVLICQDIFEANVQREKNNINQ